MYKSAAAVCCAVTREQNRAYAASQYTCMSPERIILALYDGILTAIEQAGAAIDEGVVSARGEAVGRALAIVGELQAALRPDPNPELVQALSDLYDYAAGELLKANMHGEKQPLENCAKIVRQLRDAWAEMLRLFPAVRAAAPLDKKGYL